MKDTEAFSNRVLGLMSGTSLDGLDLADCSFRYDGIRWHYRINRALTIPYSEAWKSKLAGLFTADARTIYQTDAELGCYFGKSVLEFLKDTPEKPALIASHGHTLFHNPSEGYTVQIGSGAALAALTRIDTVCDFRSKDVALGGQGAPLVPIGDQLLFGDYAACLNIGGIVNVSMNRLGKRVAWDITIANMALNWIAMQCGLPYDKDGALAAAGKINFDLLKKLEDLPFHQKQSPKSLGREWFEQEVVPLLCGETPENLSTTVCELIARQTATALAGFDEKSSVLVTGGGAHHAYLTSRIEEHCACRIVIPEHNLVDFKEALVFAFLGALYMFGQPNVLKDSTGSQRDHVGGALYRGI